MAALAVRCGEEGVNILALDVLPAAGGHVVDQLVLHAPAGWRAEDVEALCDAAGVTVASVVEGLPESLEDEPVRYLRAARELVDSPELLETLLCHLLEAAPATAEAPGMLVLDDGAGPEVRLRRGAPFTDTEWARAAELRRLALAMGSTSTTSPAPTVVLPGVPAKDLVVRRGTAADARALIELHRRCSAETVSRRYLSAGFCPSIRQAYQLLEPAAGFSFVVTGGTVGPDVLLAAAVCAPSDRGHETALLVEDGWQRQGLGARLLQAVAREAKLRGVEELIMVSRPDNLAVLATVHRSGLRARISRVDGLSRYTVSLRRMGREGGLSGAATDSEADEHRSLVGLLHRRGELRAIHPAADVIDAALRDGA
jgi:GNAT superfamily N-acetyltransferase